MPSIDRVLGKIVRSLNGTRAMLDTPNTCPMVRCRARHERMLTSETRMRDDAERFQLVGSRRTRQPLLVDRTADKGSMALVLC